MTGTVGTTKYDLLDRIISDSGGIIKTSDAVLAGISKPYLCVAFTVLTATP